MVRRPMPSSSPTASFRARLALRCWAKTGLQWRVRSSNTRCKNMMSGSLGDFVSGAEQTGRGVEVTSTNGTKTIGPLLAAFEDHGIDVPGLQLREPNLEAVFLELTGRALRD